MTGNQMLVAALHYAESGLAVFPLHTNENGSCSCRRSDCSSPAKHPRTKHGLLDATKDVERIRAWWSQWPAANIGIATGAVSGIVVLDIDPLHGGDDSIVGLREEHEDLPITRAVRTGGGGAHFYYLHPGEEIRNSGGRLGPGLDVRGDGGYVVGPPSIHISGSRYTWTAEPTLAPLPPWLLDLMRAPTPAPRPSPGRRAAPTGGGSAYGLSALDDEARRVAGAPEGTRNETLNRAAFAVGQLVGGGELDRHVAEQRLLDAGLAAGLPEPEVRRTLRSGLEDGARSPRSAPPRPGAAPETAPDAAVAAQSDDTPPALNLTELGNAERLIHRHGRDLRYVIPWREWIAYDEATGIWRRDDAEAHRRAHDTVRALYQSALEEPDAATRKAVAAFALRSESRRAIDAMIAIAATLEGVGILPDALDANVGRLVVANGVVDLRTGELHPHRREEFATRRTPIRFDARATCPRFEKYLAEVFLEDRDLIDFNVRALGYSLTGETREHVVFVDHGGGENGKSVFYSTLRHVFGTYSSTAEFSTFVVSRNEGGRPRSDVACLTGVRLVLANEGAKGAQLDEGLLKSLTGGDRKQTRDLHQKVFEFDPRFRIRLATNHPPVITGTDRGIWRRMKLVPWRATFPEGKRDEKLPATLRDEAEGILALAVRGAVAYYATGLGSCHAVEAATQEYRVSQDVIAAFVADCCTVAPDAEAAGGPLFEAYTAWAKANNEKEITNRAFADALKEHGYTKLPRTNKGARWKGLALRQDDELFGEDGPRE